MVYELASNSMKYAFPDRRAGTISVAARRDGDFVELRYADDGVGLPPEIGPGRSSGFGMILLEGLAGQIGATIDIGRVEGTRFAFRFPVN